jgi:hypothetical protein
LSVLDDHSRNLAALRHLGSTKMDGVRETLEQTFRRCGLPKAMLMDHGTPWWNGSSSIGITELTVRGPSPATLGWDGCRRPIGSGL